MIIDSFDNKTEPLARLDMIYGPQKHILDTCLLTFSREIYAEVLASFPREQIADITWANGTTPVYAITHEGRKYGFYLSPIGSAIASAYVAEANWLTGADKFIMFGSAGSLDAEKTSGRFIIPTEAYRDEGMSYHYAPPADYIAVWNHEKMAELFDQLSVPYVKGRVWTTDAMLRETVGLAAKRRAEGCIAVEMELAGVQAVCDFYGFELYDFLAAGDVLSEEDYEYEGLADANHNMDKFHIALKIASML